MGKRLAAILTLVALRSACAQSFIGLSFFPGDFQTRATCLSGDGLTVAGNAPNLFSDARSSWRWTASTGLVPLGQAGSSATSISSDGATVVGSHFDGTSHRAAFRWNNASGYALVPGVFSTVSPMPGVSADGLVVVGGATTGGSVRWTLASGATSLPNPPRGSFQQAFNTGAFDASADGAVVVGQATVVPASGPSFGVPTRWTQFLGTQIIYNTDGSAFAGAAGGVSDDGATVLVIAGNNISRWSSASSFVLLPGLSVVGPDLPALSGDGNTVVSSDKVWTLSAGTQNLTTVLTSAGCNFSGWSGLICTGVDFDGNTFCGYGTDSQGLTEAWYATVPEPASALPLLTIAFVSRRRR